MCKSGSVPPPPAFTQEERDLLKEQKLTMEQFRDMLSDESVERKETQDLLKNVSGLYKEIVTPGADIVTKKATFNPNEVNFLLAKKQTELAKGNFGGGNDGRRRREGVENSIRELQGLLRTGNVDEAKRLGTKYRTSFTQDVDVVTKGQETRKQELDKDAIGKLKGRIGETIEYDERLRKDAQDFLDKEINKPKTDNELRQERIADLQSRIVENTLRQEAGLPPVPIPTDLLGTTGDVPADTAGTGTTPPATGASAKYLLPPGWTDEMVAEQGELDKKQMGLARLQAERQERALLGNVPVTEATTQRKNEEFRLLKENLARAGHAISGDTPETAEGQSTPAIQALDAFKKRYGLIEELERQGEIASGAGTNLAQAGFLESLTQGRDAASQAKAESQLGRNLNLSSYLSGQNQQDFTNAYNVRNLANRPVGNELSYMGMAQDAGPAGLLQYYGAVPGMYSQAMQPYTNQRMLGYQANIQSAQNRAGMFNSLIQGAAGLGSAYMLMASSKKFKKNLEPVDSKEEEHILNLVKKGRSYRYDYKGEKEGPRRRHIGMLAEEAPDHVRSPDGMHIDVGNHLGFLTSAVRALTRKVDGLSAKGA